jgi:DNA invertase Pin-like site-specific DNA recombinase
MRGKITRSHLERRAVVYIRQSTVAQVLEHGESTRRQYALVDRAVALGWVREAVDVIDEDQGLSGASAERRTGFARLAHAVAHGEVGAIFAVEVSRLSRSSEDWWRLLALCALADVVVVDEQTTYDPADSDDKLLLDLKGTMSEAELHWLGLRLTGARQSKARRGALHVHVPTGYIWTDRGMVIDPDEAVQRAVRLVLERYDIEPSAWAVVRWARETGVLLPTRRWHAGGTTDVTWRSLGISRLHDMLSNPIYAGAYVYGRRQEKTMLVDGQIRRVRITGRDPDQ